GRSPEHVAAQLLLVPGRGDEWVVDTLSRAANATLAKGAADSAAAFLERALAEPPPAARRARILLELGAAEAQSSAPPALDHLRPACRGAPDDQERVAIAAFLVKVRVATAHGAEADALVREAWSRTDSGEVHRRLEAARLTAGLWDPALRDDAALAAIREHAFAGAEPLDGGACMQLAMAAYDWMGRGGSAEACVALAPRALAGGELLP